MKKNQEKRLFHVVLAKSFRRDLKRLRKAGYDITKLEAVIALLQTGKELPLSYKNHPLQGVWKTYYDCHIEPDWLLIYRIESSALVLMLMRSGTHTQLFGK